MKEIWKDIKGYENSYQISNLGNVRSKDREIIYSNGAKHYIKGQSKSQRKNQDGYLRVTLSKKSKKKNHRTYRLVAEHFIDNVNNKNQVNHIDGNKNNNNVNNLEWVTAKENMKHAWKNNLISPAKGEKSGGSKLNKKDVLDILYKLKNTKIKQKELAKKYNVKVSCISRIKNKKRWKHISLEGVVGPNEN